MSGLHGEPVFLIDARLYPSSSGSLVISTPTNYAVIDGRRMFHPEKQFVFLGIFSGNTYVKKIEDSKAIRDLEFDAGKVWHGHLIDDIISNGTNYKETN